VNLLVRFDVDWADFALVPVIGAAMVGGLTSAYLTKLTD
jgi:arginase family enzyme